MQGELLRKEQSGFRIFPPSDEEIIKLFYLLEEHSESKLTADQTTFHVGHGVSAPNFDPEFERSCSCKIQLCKQQKTTKRDVLMLDDV